MLVEVWKRASTNDRTSVRNYGSHALGGVHGSPKTMHGTSSILVILL